MQLTLNTRSLADYRTFLKVKSLPLYRVHGSTVEFPDEYMGRMGIEVRQQAAVAYEPSKFLFDYQKAIAAMAIRKRKFAIFADCGLGKTLIYHEFASHAARALGDRRCILMVAPLMVVEQTLAEYHRWYNGDSHWEPIPANKLATWLREGSGRFGITNFEALTDDLEPGRLGGMIVDESSMLKSHYGKWGQTILRLGRGLEWKLAGTGTPAPNDRIEFANHAVFLNAETNVNSFLARYFVNRSETVDRWTMKAHAIRPFYRSLAHWSIFLTNPATYGWHDHAGDIPPINVHIHSVPMTDGQNDAVQLVTGKLIATDAGGIGMRSKLGQIAKGNLAGRAIATNKPAFIRGLVESWPTESTIIWCIYNAEQRSMEATFPAAASITGDTPHEQRMRIIDDFKAGRQRVLITKPKILGFGLNLQVATRQVFSGLQDSYESYYQAVKRSNRVGSTRPLNVHIPLTDAERPMVENVLDKAHRVQSDTEEQERIFRANAAI